jgi:hypothetical protein
MTERLITIALAAAIALAVVPAQADTGNDLLKDCNSQDAKMLFCLGRLQGFADGLAVWKIVAPETATTCIPDAVTAGQARDVVVKWLTDNPQDRHLSAGAIVAHTLQRTWPCERPKP